jgi:hypothetical protein
VGGSAEPESITLHSSWRGIVLGGFGATVVAVGGTYGVSQVGFRLVPGTLFVVGWILVLAMLLDYPIAATFTSTGVTRRMVLRRQRFEWDAESQLSRARPRMIKVDRRIEHGALALIRGRRRYLLVDRLESADEFDSMVEVVEAGDSDARPSMLPRPGDKVSPTWLYRRAHWRPEWARQPRR